MKTKIILALVTLQFVSFGTNADLITINFDTDANGNPFSAPMLFADTVRLTELYAPLGVHFSGPGGPTGNDGGAIVNQSGNWGVDAHSGTNFLGFNPVARLQDNGIPRGPETITFDTLLSTISIFAAGGLSSKTFLMQGFDANGILVATDSISTQGFAQLQISWPLGIRSVQLSATSQNVSQGFVFDDLSAETVPEPSTIALLLCVTAIGFVLRRRKGLTNWRNGGVFSL